MAFDIMDDIRALLLSIVPDINGELVSDKDICLSIGNTGGQNPEHTFSGGNSTYQKPVITHPSFQIVMRHPKESLMHGLWDQIINALDGKTNYTVSNRTYLIIEQQGDVLDLGRDDNRRHLQALNFNTSIINTR